MPRKQTLLQLVVFFVAVAAFIFSFTVCISNDGDDSTLSGNETPGQTSDDDDDTADDDTADDDTGEEDDFTVAIIYNRDSSAPDDFGKLLTLRGYDYFAIHEDNLPGGNFSGADVILVDAQTDWYVDAAAQAVWDTGLPVLALGPGGLNLFDHFGLSTGFFNALGPYFGHNAIMVQAPLHSVFDYPTKFVVSEGDFLDLFLSGVDLYSVDIDPTPTGVKVIGSMEDDSRMGTVLLEGGIYLSWGFDLTYSDLNSNGRGLLVNCLYYLAHL